MRANLTKADLRGCNMRGADLTSANLAGASLEGVILIGATISSANFEGTSLVGALLDEADFAHTRIQELDRDAQLARAGAWAGADPVQPRRLDAERRSERPACRTGRGRPQWPGPARRRSWRGGAAWRGAAANQPGGCAARDGRFVPGGRAGGQSDQRGSARGEAGAGDAEQRHPDRSVRQAACWSPASTGAPPIARRRGSITRACCARIFRWRCWSART